MISQKRTCPPIASSEARGLEGKIFQLLPRAKRDAWNEKLVHQLPRAKREAKMGDLFNNCLERSERLRRETFSPIANQDFRLCLSCRELAVELKETSDICIPAGKLRLITNYRHCLSFYFVDYDWLWYKSQRDTF